MSNAISRQEMVRSLEGKGFVLSDRDQDHDYYYFYHKGKRTVARTKVSRGTKFRDYNDEMFRLMRSSLKLNTIGEVRDLLKCPLSQGAYADLLKGKGALHD
ncbi:MAG TPA: hypothetical protein VFI02_01425 [Armatimonadota bacterium]|nr:hypothetical protein [Armatimonadota bacterium]